VAGDTSALPASVTLGSRRVARTISRRPRQPPTPVVIIASAAPQRAGALRTIELLAAAERAAHDPVVDPAARDPALVHPR